MKKTSLVQEVCGLLSALFKWSAGPLRNTGRSRALRFRFAQKIIAVNTLASKEVIDLLVLNLKLAEGIR